jgi:hypothetical protein
MVARQVVLMIPKWPKSPQALTTALAREDQGDACGWLTQRRFTPILPT